MLAWRPHTAPCRRRLAEGRICPVPCSVVRVHQAMRVLGHPLALLAAITTASAITLPHLPRATLPPRRAARLPPQRMLADVVSPAAKEVREAEHARRLAAAIGAGPVRSTYRRGSNRVPNGAPPTGRPDLSLLREVLYVSPDQATVTAEPGVTMEELVAATLPHGLVPKVVPEFRRITVGGAIMGGAMESGSFAHGMFHETVSACELVLPNGTVVLASRAVHADMLAALGGSYGSLATLTAATIECVRLRTCGSRPPRVALTFTWHEDVSRGVEVLSGMARARTRTDGGRLDFLDGVALPNGTTAGGILICAGCLDAGDHQRAAGHRHQADQQRVEGMQQRVEGMQQGVEGEQGAVGGEAHAEARMEEARTEEARMEDAAAGMEETGGGEGKARMESSQVKSSQVKSSQGEGEARVESWSVGVAGDSFTMRSYWA